MILPPYFTQWPHQLTKGDVREEFLQLLGCDMLVDICEAVWAVADRLVGLQDASWSVVPNFQEVALCFMKTFIPPTPWTTNMMSSLLRLSRSATSCVM